VVDYSALVVPTISATPRICHGRSNDFHDLRAPGVQIVQSLGVVRGVTVRSCSILGTIGAKIETFVGGHIVMLTSLCETARADAFEILQAHAQRWGANAIVGIRYDAAEVMAGVTEVLCYGTAVIVEPLDDAANDGVA
jgi:uncharacterized protein YbjQ (UPF0145 family)